MKRQKIHPRLIYLTLLLLFFIAQPTVQARGRRWPRLMLRGTGYVGVAYVAFQNGTDAWLHRDGKCNYAYKMPTEPYQKCGHGLLAHWRWKWCFLYHTLTNNKLLITMHHQAYEKARLAGHKNPRQYATIKGELLLGLYAKRCADQQTGIFFPDSVVMQPPSTMQQQPT